MESVETGVESRPLRTKFISNLDQIVQYPATMIWTIIPGALTSKEHKIEIDLKRSKLYETM